SSDYAYSLGVSPDGARVYVTGQSYGSGSSYDYATLAYDALTGAKLWEVRYNGPGNYDDRATSLGVSPDGARLYVTGYSYGSGSSYDYATLAYDATGLCTEDGPVSGPVDGTVEPLAGGASPTVQKVNCDVVVANGL
ncbi:MAG: hypothetical protein HY775_12715, partial [Acidobacteria bacterium]|nr:hypothetical protein [Acidobacteriota bacterium]